MAKKHDFSIRERVAFGSENSPRYHEIRKGGMVLDVTPVLTGTLVVTGGTVNGTATGENPGNAVQRFDIDATPRIGSPYPGGKIKSLTPRSVLCRRIFDKGFKQGDMSLAGGTFNGAAGSYTFNQAFPLRFALPNNAVRPIETALNTDQYDGLQLQITTGGRNTLFSGNDRTFDWSGARFDIYDRRENGAPGDVAVLYESDQFVPIAGANARLPIDGELPKNEGYLDILLIAETTGQALADTIIKKVNISSGTDQFSEMYSEYIKQLQREFVTDASENMTGLYLLPIAQDGLLMGAVKPVSLLLDVANPGGAGVDRLIVSSRRVILPHEYLPSK
jgi:hypothetical protein